MQPLAILSGIGAGLTYSLSAFLKKEHQEWDWEKFSITFILGIITGVTAAFAEMPTEAAYMACLAAVPIIENVLKIIKRKILNIH